MEAKDTVMSEEQIYRIIEDSGVERSPYLDFAIRLPLEAQAELSFKAGEANACKKIGEWLAKLIINSNAIANELRIVWILRDLLEGKLPEEVRDE